jgi:hypothetical protein
MKTYKGYSLVPGRTFQDWSVNLNGRTRWGTLDEVRSDVDAHLNGTLPEPKRGGF